MRGSSSSARRRLTSSAREPPASLLAHSARAWGFSPNRSKQVQLPPDRPQFEINERADLPAARYSRPLDLAVAGLDQCLQAADVSGRDRV